MEKQIEKMFMLEKLVLIAHAILIRLIINFFLVFFLGFVIKKISYLMNVTL